LIIYRFFMVRLSRLKLDDKVLNKLSILLFEVVGKTNDSNKFSGIMRDLLSSSERIMLAKRIAIIYLLLKKIDYLTICDVIKVSPSTVAKFSLLLEKSEEVTQTFSSILRQEKVLNFVEGIFNDLFAPGTIGVNWSNAWRRKNVFERKQTQGI